MRLTDSENNIINPNKEQPVVFRMDNDNFPFMFMLNADYVTIKGIAIAENEVYTFNIKVVANIKKNFFQRVKHIWRCFKRFVKNDLSSLTIHPSKMRLYVNLARYINSLECEVKPNDKKWERAIYKHNLALNTAYMHINVIEITSIIPRIYR